MIFFLTKASTSLVTIRSCVPVTGCGSVCAEVVVPVLAAELVRYRKELPLELRSENSSMCSRILGGY